MSVIQPISIPASGECARLVFLHGLGGDPRETWQGKGTAGFWPSWLGEDFPDVAIYSSGYDASPSGWLGGTMPLADRAIELLALLEADSFASQPLILIGHSLGGLLIKQLLRTAVTYQRKEWQSIATRTRGVVLIATPNSGSQLANYLAALRLIARTSVSVRELEANSGQLRDLNLWYRNNVKSLGILTHAFYETKEISGVRVVDESSADPGIEGVIPIPLDEDHIEITKPLSRESTIYKSTVQFIRSALVQRSPHSLLQASNRLIGANESLAPSTDLTAEGASEVHAPISQQVELVDNSRPSISPNNLEGKSEAGVPNPKRYSVSIPAATAERIGKIKERIEASSDSEVVRRAIRLYARLINGEVTLNNQSGSKGEDADA